MKLNEKIEPVDLIRSTTSVKILYPTIDTSSPGVKKLLYIAVGEDGEQKEFMKEIRVVTPKPPVLQLKKDTVEIYVKEAFDARAYVKKAYSDYDGDRYVYDHVSGQRFQRPYCHEGAVAHRQR